jgi:hypothetical protein
MLGTGGLSSLTKTREFVRIAFFASYLVNFSSTWLSDRFWDIADCVLEHALELANKLISDAHSASDEN